ncbi:hypothetical protein Tco_0428856 [Tanacetum coccineum]
MSFDPRLLAYVESPICILALTRYSFVILFDCCNPWSSLISLSRGSFDVIVGIDWLSKRKFVIVCHEKVVEIPLEGSRKLRVKGERTLGVAKALMNAKVEFRIDLVHEVTSVAKSPYHLAPLKMQELSEQLQELQDKGFIRPSHFPEELESTYDTIRDMIILRIGRMKPRRVQAVAMTIQYGVRGMILAVQSEAFKQDNCAPFEALYGRKCRSPVIWVEIGESSLTGLELVQEMTDKFLFDELRYRVLKWRCYQLKVLTSLLDDGQGSGSWMFLFVWSGYAAMRTLLWAGKVVSCKISCFVLVFVEAAKHQL